MTKRVPTSCSIIISEGVSRTYDIQSVSFSNVTIYVFDRDEIDCIHLPELTKFFWVDKQFPNSFAGSNNHITRWLKISHKPARCVILWPQLTEQRLSGKSLIVQREQPNLLSPLNCCVQEESRIDSINNLLVEWIPAPTRGLEMQFYPMPRRQRDPEITSTAPTTTTVASGDSSCVGVVSVLCFLLWLNKKKKGFLWVTTFNGSCIVLVIYIHCLINSYDKTLGVRHCYFCMKMKGLNKWG